MCKKTALLCFFFLVILLPFGVSNNTRNNLYKYILLFPFLSDCHCGSFFRRSRGGDLPLGLALALGLGLRRRRRLVESEVICAESLSHLGGRTRAQPLHGLDVDVVSSEAGELRRRTLLRGTFPNGHPLIASFLGLLRLEVEVPALGVLLGDLLEFLAHESQVLAVVDGAEQVLPQPARLGSPDGQAGGRTPWP